MSIPAVMWAFVVIGGPVLLAVVVLWDRLGNGAQSGSRARTEADARRVYGAEERGRPEGVLGQPSSHFLKSAVGIPLLVIAMSIVSMIIYHPNGAPDRADGPVASRSVVDFQAKS